MLLEAETEPTCLTCYHKYLILSSMYEVAMLNYF